MMRSHPRRPAVANLPSITGVALLIVGASLPFLSAATITSVGAQLGVGPDVRETDVPKTLDLDGDNVLGTAGHYFWNADPADPGAESGQPFDDDALIDLPSWVDSVTPASANVYSAGGWGYSPIDDPRETPDADVTNLPEAGQVAVDQDEFGFFGDEAPVYDIALTGDVPALFRLSFITDTFENDGKNLPESFRVAGAGGDSGQITFDRITRKDVDVYFVEVTGAQVGDSLTVYLTNRSGNVNVIANSALGFDIPEPASFALLAGGGVLFLRRRK